MAMSEDKRPTRPRLALRVGISGARRLRADQMKRLERELLAVFGAVKAGIDALALEPAVRGVYELGEGSARLVCYSPLARGADRMAAGAALANGYELCVPMPFVQAVYENDFTGSTPDHPEEQPLSAAEDLTEFRELLTRAVSAFPLDGARSDAASSSAFPLETQSYEAVGRYVVRNSDVLLAVWDGRPSAGQGGTAEIVEYAARTGVPVWWIHAEQDVPVKWLVDIQDLRDPVAASTPAPEALTSYLRRLVCPPAAVEKKHEGLIDRMIRKRGMPDSFVSLYFAEKPLVKRRIWRTYSTVMRWAAGGGAGSYTEPQRPAGVVAESWFDRYSQADGLASGYAARYRSSYVLVIAMTALAVIFGAVAPGTTSSRWAVQLAIVLPLAELAMLVGVMVLLVMSQRYEWHRRSIEYRLLAELLRKQQTLAPLGRGLSLGLVEHLATKEWLWIAWLFAALERGAPLPTSCDHSTPQAEPLRALIAEQLEYHRNREEVSRGAAERLEMMGVLLFTLVCVSVVLKLPAELRDWSPHLRFLLDLAAIALPAISAGFVGLRSYAELQLLAEQSFHMIAELTRAQNRVNRLDLKRPLASQDLGAEGVAIATVMMQDLEGWGRLFRGKLVEAG